MLPSKQIKIKDSEDIMQTSYVNSTYHQLNLTARYLKKFCTQIFEKIGAEISLDEFIVLDILKNLGSMCQRDLAKQILKDRANTGRICNELCAKKYIEIKIEEKNNRPIKNCVLTRNGKKYFDKLSQKVRPIFEEIMQYFDEEEEKKLQYALIKCREILQKIVEIQI